MAFLGEGGVSACGHIKETCKRDGGLNGFPFASRTLAQLVVADLTRIIEPYVYLPDFPTARSPYAAAHMNLATMRASCAIRRASCGIAAGMAVWNARGR